MWYYGIEKQELQPKPSSDFGLTRLVIKKKKIAKMWYYGIEKQEVQPKPSSDFGLTRLVITKTICKYS